MRIVIALLALLPCAAFADDAMERKAALQAEIERLEQERDAARVKANIYVLPQHKLEAEAKQKEIDERRKELEALD